MMGIEPPGGEGFDQREERRIVVIIIMIKVYVIVLFYGLIFFMTKLKYSDFVFGS